MTDTELRRLAENARDLPRGYDWPMLILAYWSGELRAEEYLAAASPDVVLALLDRIKALEVERDARPAISREDAVYFVQACQQSGMDDEDDDSFRVTWEALRSHAAKGGE